MIDGRVIPVREGENHAKTLFFVIGFQDKKNDSTKE